MSLLLTALSPFRLFSSSFLPSVFPHPHSSQVRPSRSQHRPHRSLAHAAHKLTQPMSLAATDGVRNELRLVSSTQKHSPPTTHSLPRHVVPACYLRQELPCASWRPARRRSCTGGFSARSQTAAHSHRSVEPGRVRLFSRRATACSSLARNFFFLSHSFLLTSLPTIPPFLPPPLPPQTAQL